MKRVLYALLLCLSVSGVAQVIPDLELIPVNPDSCRLVVYDVVTKEMMAPLEKERKKELATVSLSITETDGLMAHIAKKSSYKDSRAMLTHSNMVFECYKGKALAPTISISTITGNIEILNGDNGLEFHGGVSGKFGKYFLKLLEQYHLIDLIDPLDLDGLKQN